jgi:hypothetical protein
MTATCAETEINLINPYISIEYHSKTGKRGAGINTQSFADCQRMLIHPINDALREELKRERKILYEVHAVVAEYNNPLDLAFGPLQEVSVFRAERGRIFLGWLEESVVRANLPRTYAYLNQDKSTN